MRGSSRATPLAHLGTISFVLLHREQRLSNDRSNMRCWQGTILGPVPGAGTAEPPEVPGVTQGKAVTLAMHRGGRELVSCGLWEPAGLWRQGVGTMRGEQHRRKLSSPALHVLSNWTLRSGSKISPTVWKARVGVSCTQQATVLRNVTLVHDGPAP